MPNATVKVSWPQVSYTAAAIWGLIPGKALSLEQINHKDLYGIQLLPISVLNFISRHFLCITEIVNELWFCGCVSSGGDPYSIFPAHCQVLKLIFMSNIEIMEVKLLFLILNFIQNLSKQKLLDKAVFTIGCIFQNEGLKDTVTFLKQRKKQRFNGDTDCAKLTNSIYQPFENLLIKIFYLTLA